MIDAESLARAIQRENKMFIDNLGIGIDTSKLPTNEGYKKASDEYYGHNRITRFWYTKVRPWLNPKKHYQARKNYEAWHVLHKQAYLNAVLEQGLKQL